MDVIIKKNYEEICNEAVQIIYESWEKKKNLVLGLPLEGRLSECIKGSSN